MSIILIGPSGSGKTSCGKLLSQKLGWTFADTDNQIEVQVGMPVKEIFAVHGENYFRRLETEFLKKLTASETTLNVTTPNVKTHTEPFVLSTGGGMPITEGNFELLERLGDIIFLTAELDKLVDRLSGDASRPLLAKSLAENNLRNTLAEKLREMLVVREPIYKRASYCIDTSNLRPSQVVNQILQFLKISI